jgi:GTP-binding protein
MFPEIIKGSATFIRGLEYPQDVMEWMSASPDIKGLAFIGRSNTGKSTTINRLFGRNTARTSKEPGRTRQINVFSFSLTGTEQKYHLFDLPGYGYAKVSKAMQKNWNHLMNAFFMNAPKGLTMVNIQDARHPHQKADQQFYQYFKNFPAHLILVFNKMDKLRNQKQKSALMQTAKSIGLPSQIHFISAEKATGVDSLTQSLIGTLH